MLIPVRMLAFNDHERGDPLYRLVYIPDLEWVEAESDSRLGLVFHYGQNDFQPKKCCSVSVADVVFLPVDPLEINNIQPAGSGLRLDDTLLNGFGAKDWRRTQDIRPDLLPKFTFHVVKPTGFGEITLEQLKELETMEQRDRSLCEIVNQ